VPVSEIAECGILIADWEEREADGRSSRQGKKNGSCCLLPSAPTSCPLKSAIRIPQSIKSCLHAAQSFGGLREGGLLFEGEAVVARGVEGASALLVDATEVEVREGV
jgi:hypothetical protein